MKRLGFTFFKMVFVALLPATMSLAAEEFTGIIRGTIIDGESHAPIGQVTVRLVQENRSQPTDENGNFLFSSLQLGRYTIEATRIGYQKSVINVTLGSDSATSAVIIHLYPAPVQSSGVIITGEHFDSRLDEVQHEANVLHGQDLQRDMGQTLAATLKNETGLAIRSMGPAPARPIIRGLGGDRIVISEDGQKTGDLSATSPDHAVTIEPFTVDRIEVQRGPKVLLYNSTTVGGIVNIIREEIPRSLPEHVTGNAGFFGESASRGYLGSVVMAVPMQSFVGRVEVSRKKASDLHTPIGRLKNSDLATTNYSGGLSAIGAWGFAGGAFREYSSNYGVPGGVVGAHPNGVDIDLLRRHWSADARWNIDTDQWEGLTVNADRTYYRHTEFEASGLIGAQFKILTYSGRMQLDHRDVGSLHRGSWGLSFETRDFTIGGFVFTPATKSLNAAAFAYESFTWSKLDLQFAARLNYDRVSPDRDDPSARIGHIRQRKFFTFSLSGSLLYALQDGWFIGTNLSRSSRTPTIEELYSEGPHLAAYSYEVGNPNLRDEFGIGVEFFTYYKSPAYYLMLTGFHNEMSSYIISQNSGKTNFTTLLPTYVASGVPARFSGAEAQFEWKITGPLSLALSGSYTDARRKDSGVPLPAIPPLKGLVELKYRTQSLGAGLNSEFAARQGRVSEFEEPTAGYGVIGGFVQYSMPTGGLLHNLSLTVDNIFDKEYRNHLSRLKAIIPEMGRNARLVYRMFF